ncbi:hypothetical protein ACIA78_38685 [Streptomyces xanthochromogenes]|uniref:hypothetical protein n=1 Tax=Streptomyces xanthochromogenes TaxID=67384 RepID=UPI00379B9B9D
MSAPEVRPAEACLPLPSIAAPVATHTPALRGGRYVAGSGQLGTSDCQLVDAGRRRRTRRTGAGRARLLQIPLDRRLS